MILAVSVPPVLARILTNLESQDVVEHFQFGLPDPQFGPVVGGRRIEPVELEELDRPQVCCHMDGVGGGAFAIVIIGHGQIDDVGGVIVGREAEVRVGAGGIGRAVFRDRPGKRVHVGRAGINHRAGEVDFGSFRADSRSADDRGRRVDVADRDKSVVDVGCSVGVGNPQPDRQGVRSVERGSVE